MQLSISAKIERWPVKGAFTISRGAKTHVDVLVCNISDGNYTGLGEGTAIYYDGETAENCLKQINEFALQNMSFDHISLLTQMPRGAARNAVDCALWDLETRRANQPLWQIAGLPEPRPLISAFTISLGDARQMETDAKVAVNAGHILLKLKLSGKDDQLKVAAVRRGAPKARLIVDANESWNNLDIAAEAEALLVYGVELIEQPVSAGRDELLAGVCCPIPLCADESCHTSADVAKIAPFYDAVNIKLDKSGGLTEAMNVSNAAQAAGLKIMVGCMLSTSLAIRPAFSIAQRASWVDLDGPLLLARDRDEAFKFYEGMICPARDSL